MSAVTPRRFEPPEPGTIESRTPAGAGTSSPTRSWWTSVLRFSPAVAARVTRGDVASHPACPVEPDGSLVWRATVAGTIEVRLWILSWGDDVEVLAPGLPATT